MIVNYIDRSLEQINVAAGEQGLPIRAQKVVPNVSDSFWVNLLGRGYPAPSKRFRWCTERLKIDPANAFIRKKVAEFGEVVMVLGVRKAESATRAQVMSPAPDQRYGAVSPFHFVERICLYSDRSLYCG